MAPVVHFGEKSELNEIKSNNACYRWIFSYFVILVPSEKLKIVSLVNTYINKIINVIYALLQSVVRLGFFT